MAGSDNHRSRMTAGHLVNTAGIPGGNDVVFFLGIFFDFFNSPTQLVDSFYATFGFTRRNPDVRRGATVYGLVLV